jgi:hypothetical protein
LEHVTKLQVVVSFGWRMRKRTKMKTTFASEFGCGFAA